MAQRGVQHASRDIGWAIPSVPRHEGANDILHVLFEDRDGHYFIEILRAQFFVRALDMFVESVQPVACVAFQEDALSLYELP